MPTDLPPDYKPKPASDPTVPDDPNAPGAVPTPGGADSRDPTGRPRPGPDAGLPGPEGDVVDPAGWSEPPVGPAGGIGVPSPAGTPTF